MTDSHDPSLEPAAFLVENVDLLPKGRALDIAMGYGRNAIFLAKAGFEVEGVDISDEAAAGASRAAMAAGVNLSVRVADIEAGYAIDAGAYEVILCFNYLHRPLIPEIRKGLSNGGMVVYETFIVDQARFGRPRNRDHLLEHNELLDMFRGFRCLRYHEGIMGPHRAVAGIIAEKP